MEQLYKIHQVANFLNCSKSTIYNWIRRKDLKIFRHYYKPGNGPRAKILISEKQLENILKDLSEKGRTVKA